MPSEESTSYAIFIYSSKQSYSGASLVVQWLKICFAMQGTHVQPLIQEDPTGRGATKPVCRNY